MKKNNEYGHDPLDELRKDSEINSSNKSSSNMIVIASILVVATAIAGVAWYMYSASQDLPEGEILVISADNEEIKTKPADPGGMVVDNMDKSIYDSIDTQAKNEDDKPTTLLPVAEEPVDRNMVILEEQASVTKEGEILPEAVLLVEETVTDNIPESAKAVEPVIKPKEEYIKPVAKKDSPKKAIEFAKKDKKSFYKVQVASFRSSSDAEKEWANLSKRFPKLIGGYQHYVVAKDIEGKGVFYRLQMGPFTKETDARKACTQLKEVGKNCLLVKPS